MFFSWLFVRLRISPARIKLAASNFARWFIGVLGRESPILGNFAPQNPKIGRIGHPPGSKVQGGKSFRNHVSINIARRVDVSSACVDIRPSPKTDVLAGFCGYAVRKVTAGLLKISGSLRVGSITNGKRRLPETAISSEVRVEYTLSF